MQITAFKAMWCKIIKKIQQRYKKYKIGKNDTIHKITVLCIYFSSNENYNIILRTIAI